MASGAKIHHELSGSKQVVESGGEIELKSGAALTGLAGAVVDLSAATVNLPAGQTVQADIEAASLDGTIAKVVANVNIIGGLLVLYRITVADAASGATNVTLTHKTRVIDVWCVKTGGAGHATEDTIVVGNAGTAITDAIALGAADKAIKRAATIDDAAHEIAAAGSLRVTWVKGAGGGNNPACEVYVLGIRVA